MTKSKMERQDASGYWEDKAAKKVHWPQTVDELCSQGQIISYYTPLPFSSHLVYNHEQDFNSPNGSKVASAKLSLKGYFLGYLG